MGRRFSNKIVHKIKIYIETGEAVLAIVKAVKVAKKTIYKM